MHVPFARWVVAAARPELLVELGTHEGASYAAFCDAVQRLGLSTRCHAVDTWQGDEHTEFYGEEVFERLRTFHDARYGAFSTLHRTTFDDARAGFPDGSIDLLHIDGCHSEAEVRHDWDTWRSALSRRGVALFHGTEVREHGFGVWRLWAELREGHPSFAFTHGHGLGLLAVGPDVPPDVLALCALPEERADLVRSLLAALGASADFPFQTETRLRSVRAETEAARKAAIFDIESARSEFDLALRTERAALTTRAENAEKRVDELAVTLRDAEADRAAILASTSWRLTAPRRVFIDLGRAMARRQTARLLLLARAILLQDHGARHLLVTSLRRQFSRGQREAFVGEKTAKHRLSAHLKAELRDFLASGNRIAFSDTDLPDISVLIVLWNQAHLTLRCLRALHSESAGGNCPSLEVVLIDNASSDETAELLSHIYGPRVIRNQQNVGFVRAANQAAAVARGRGLLFLNNDAFVRSGALVAALADLERAPDVGAVGGRLIMPSGLLQEAGSIIWSDASTLGYGRGLAADAGEVMFRRDVDYCSAAFLMTSRGVWEKLGGFSASYAPAYYEEADYCMRLREAGFRVVYEPSAAVDHYEFGSEAKSGAAVAATLANRKRFRIRHADVLRLAHFPYAPTNVLAARERRTPARRRMLVFDNEVPLRALGSGYPRMRELLVEAVAAGWSVSFFPLRAPNVDWAIVRPEIPWEIEILSSRGAPGVADLLEERRGYYDLVLVSRPDNMALLRAVLCERPHLMDGTRLVYDAEALFAARTIARAAFEGRPIPVGEAQRMEQEEVALADGADTIICVTEAEAKAFRLRQMGPVHVLSNPTAVALDAPGFESRDGFLFVGRLLEPEAPNWRGLAWFLREVWPLVRAKLPEAAMMVAGHLYPNFCELEAPGVTLLGPVAELRPLYDAARVFVAPINFAAGVPIKILEAVAAGLPAAATRLMARQLSWTPGVEIAAEDEPAAFATAAVTLHQSETVWSAMRAAAQTRLAREHGRERFRNQLRALLDGAPSPGTFDFE